MSSVLPPAALRIAGLLALLLAGGCAHYSGMVFGEGELDAFLRDTKGLGAGWDELWLVERDANPSGNTPRARGGLRIVRSDNSVDPVVPTRIELRADVLGRLASVQLVEEYAATPSDEAQFEFELALPDAAAVRGFELMLGTRQIRAVVRPRASAQRLYRAARARGLTTSLLTVDERGVFRHQLGSLPADQPIALTVRYTHAIPLRSGWCELDLPAAANRGAPTAVEIAIRAGATIDRVDAGRLSDRAVVARPALDRATVAIDSPSGDPNPCQVRWHVARDAPSVLFWGEQPDTGQRFGLWTSYGPSNPRGFDRLEMSAVHPSPEAAWTNPGVTLVGRLAAAPPRSTADQRTLPAGDAVVAIAHAWATLELAAMAKQSQEVHRKAELLELAGRAEKFALEHGLVSYLTALQSIDTTSRGR